MQFCRRCGYQLENRRAQCRACGNLHSKDGLDHGDPSKPWFGVYTEEWDSMCERDQIDHYNTFEAREGLFDDSEYRFIYRPERPRPRRNRRRHRRAESEKETEQPLLAQSNRGSTVDIQATGHRATNTERVSASPSPPQSPGPSRNQRLLPQRRNHKRGFKTEETTPRSEPKIVYPIYEDDEVDDPEQQVSETMKDRLNAQYSDAAPESLALARRAKRVDAKEPKAPDPSAIEELQNMSTYPRGYVREKHWLGAVCGTCSSDHPTEVHDNHDKYLEVWIDAYSLEGDCALCAGNENRRRSHHVYQHGMGCFRDHPANAALPETLIGNACPWPDSSDFTPFPRGLYRPKLFHIPSRYEHMKLPPILKENGILAGVWKNKVEVGQLEISLAKGFAMAIDDSKKLLKTREGEALRRKYTSRPRHISRRPESRIGFSVDSMTGETRLQIYRGARYGGLNHDSMLADPTFAVGQPDWFSESFCDDIEPVMERQDATEYSRLQDIHRSCGFDKQNRDVVKQANAAALAWKIVACYIPGWRHGMKDGETNRSSAFEKAIKDVRADYGKWPERSSEKADKTPLAVTAKLTHDVKASQDDRKKISKTSNKKQNDTRARGQTLAGSSTNPANISSVSQSILIEHVESEFETEPFVGVARRTEFLDSGLKVFNFGEDGETSAGTSIRGAMVDPDMDLATEPCTDEDATKYIEFCWKWHTTMGNLELSKLEEWTTWFTHKCAGLQKDIDQILKMQPSTADAFVTVVELFRETVVTEVEALRTAIEGTVRPEILDMKMTMAKWSRRRHRNQTAFEKYETAISNLLTELASEANDDIYHWSEERDQEGLFNGAFEGINGAWLPGPRDEYPETCLKLLCWPKKFVEEQ